MYEGACVKSCPDGTFSGQLVCQRCHYSCRSCHGPESNQCIDCHTDATPIVHLLDSVQCLPISLANEFYDSQWYFYLCLAFAGNVLIFLSVIIWCCLRSFVRSRPQKGDYQIQNTLDRVVYDFSSDTDG